MSTIRSTQNGSTSRGLGNQAAARRQTLTKVVVEKLREEIISGQLAPGAMVAEIPTAERLGVSRVPVREATLVLEQEGLLILKNNGRRRVRTLTSTDFHEIFGVRMMLEVESFRLAARNHTADSILALEANISQMEKARSLTQLTLLDLEFHDLIMKAAGQSVLQHLWDVMRGQLQMFTAVLQRDLSQGKFAVKKTTIANHRKVVAALQSGEEQIAMDAARTHLLIWGNWLKSKGQ